MVSNRLFSYGLFLPMEQNSFAVVTQKKKKEKTAENHLIPENVLFYTKSFNTTSPNSHPPILPIKL